MASIPFFLLGALYSFLGFTVFVCSDVFTKASGLNGASPLAILSLSGLAAALTVFIGLVPKRDFKKLLPTRWGLQSGRILLFLLCSYANVLAFTNLPLTTVYIGLFASPFLISLLGKVFLHESLSRVQVGTILLGFIGVVIALAPEMHQGATIGTENPILGWAALPVFLVTFVITMLMLRVLGRTDTSESLTFWIYFVRGVLFLPIFFINPLTEMSWQTILFIIGSGVLSGIGFLLTTAAYKLAPVAIASSFHYTQLVTGAILGYLVWGTVPSPFVFAGGVLIIVSGIIMAREAGRAPQEKAAEALTLQDHAQQSQAL